MRGKRTWIIFLICYLAYTSIYVARLNLSMASPGLISAGILDKAQIGMLGSAFSVIYACGRLLNGGIGDRVMPWIMISSGLMLAGIGNIFIGLFPPFVLFAVLWGINAYAQSMLWSSVLKIVANIYDEATAKRNTTYMVTSVATGNIIGIIFSTFLISRFGLRYAFIIPGTLTIFFSILVASFTKNIGKASANSKPQSVFSVIKDRQIIISLFPAMFHGVIKDNISLWMTVYFVDKFAVDLNKSAYFVLFIPAVGFVGRLTYPFLYKIFGNMEHKVSALAFILCVICCIPLIAGVGGPLVATVCLSLIYACVSLINTSFLSMVPMQYTESGNISSVSGIMDFTTYLGAGIGSAVYGVVIKSYGYSPMFISWAVISALSILLLIPLLKFKCAE